MPLGRTTIMTKGAWKTGERVKNKAQLTSTRTYSVPLRSSMSISGNFNWLIQCFMHTFNTIMVTDLIIIHCIFVFLQVLKVLEGRKCFIHFYMYIKVLIRCLFNKNEWFGLETRTCFKKNLEFLNLRSNRNMSIQ